MLHNNQGVFKSLKTFINVYDSTDCETNFK